MSTAIFYLGVGALAIAGGLGLALFTPGLGSVVLVYGLMLIDHGLRAAGEYLPVLGPGAFAAAAGLALWRRKSAP